MFDHKFEDDRRGKLTVEVAAAALGLEPIRGAAWRDHLLEQALPYGIWQCRDGRQILFNRAYQPIWERYWPGPATRADPDEQVRFIRQGWFYGYKNGPRSPWRDRKTVQGCLGILKQFGVEL